MPDILFIKTSSLGDVIHHMPALTEARRQLPDARFAWVVEEAFAPLVRLHPAVAEVIPVALRRWRQAALSPATWVEAARCVRGLRAHRYDAVVDTQGLALKSALIARLARGPRHGYDPDSIRERAATWLYDVRHRVARDLHAIARNRALTGHALGYAPEGTIDFGLERAALADGAADPYGILLHATARPEKEWIEASWAALAPALRARNAALVLPWGTPAERQRSESIAAALRQARLTVRVPAERQPLDSMARLIAGASFVVGVDTGLLHLAAALGVPLVAIFVGSEPGLTGPMGAGPIAVVGGKRQFPSVAGVVGALDSLSSHHPP
jgi:heptosyltransferase I